MTFNDLRNWLGSYPWLIILDGLDEAPSSSNRSEVMEKVSDFQIDIASVSADVLIIGTTRPQGYNDDFSPRRYQHLWLAPLSEERSLHYGSCLAENMHPTDDQRIEDIRNRLKKAVKTSATARLMQSPLQVTIMARLLAQVAEPPRERYRLFQQYYEVIQQREMEREIEPLSRILRDYKSDIDAIHHQVGLLLQIKSEKAKHTDATISKDDFLAIVNQRLEKEGHQGDDLKQLAQHIVNTAMDRLVFLVPAKREEIGFEIRSLQEFMAAEALIDGGDKDVVERLRTIAPIQYWHNVFLFAAGHCFLKRQHLRGNIAAICGEMNEGPNDPFDQNALLGSRLAVSLLEDGLVRSQPKYKEVITRLIFRLLSLPIDSIHEQLPGVYEQALEPIYRDEINSRLNMRDLKDQLAAWRIVVDLKDKDIPLADEFIESHWSMLDVQNKALLIKTLFTKESSWLLTQLSEIFFHLSTSEAKTIFNSITDYSHKYSYRTSDIIYNSMIFESHTFNEGLTIPFTTPNGNQSSISFNMHDTKYHFDMPETVFSQTNYHKSWDLYSIINKFSTSPNKTSLAQVLKYISDLNDIKDNYYIDGPWQIMSCLYFVEDKTELKILADKIEDGVLGDEREWSAAERRFTDNGISVMDIEYTLKSDLPYDSKIDKIGFPYHRLGFTFNMGARSDNVVSTLIGSFLEIISARQIKILAPDILLFLDHCSETFVRSLVKDHDTIQRILSLSSTNNYSSYKIYRIIHKLVDQLDIQNDDKFYKGLNILGNGIGAFSLFRFTHSKIERERLVNLYSHWQNSPSQTGILRILAILSLQMEIIEIPQDTLDKVLDRNPEQADAVHLLRFSNMNLTADEFASLAKETLELSEDHPKFVFASLRCFANHQMENPHADQYIANILDNFKGGKQEILKAAMPIILRFLSRRTCSFDQHEKWKEFGLPEELRLKMRS